MGLQVGESFSLNDIGESRLLKGTSAPALTPDLVNFQVPAQEKTRLANDGARYKAKGFLPADFQIAELTDYKLQGQKPIVFERPASQALEPMPPLSESLKLSPYDSSIKLNVQITNVPDVTAGISGKELVGYFGTVLRSSADAVLPIAEHLAQPNAVKTDLIDAGNALYGLPEYVSRNPDQLITDGKNTVYWATQQAGAVLDRLDKPMTPDERAAMAGSILPLFVIGGKLIHPQAVEEMGLANMSEAELEKLGIKRFEMPKLNLERDEFSVKASIPGDPKAFVEANVPSPGVVNVTYINRGNLPEGMGGNLLAQTLQGHGALPTHRLVFSGIINPETLDQFWAGVAPERTLLGKSGAKAMRVLGIEPTSYNFETVRGKLNLVIEAK
jgi:hypothetical protein